MNATRPAAILRQLEQSCTPDATLLARFIASRDADAFAELVRRHGPLVLGVCRRVTGHSQDAEDAFQATFLVLAKRAASLHNPACLGSWLYQVAYRVAWKARRAATRRRAREVQVPTLPEPESAPLPLMADLSPVLDEELAALPACYRDAIVLCDLHGASREEAAKALGIPEGTLSSRLANGRKKLAARLMKRGITLSVAALPGAVTNLQAAITVSHDLITKTSGLVSAWLASGAVPAALARLVEGGFAVQKTFMLGAVLAVAAAGAVFAARPGDEAPATPPAAVAQKPETAPQPKEEAKPEEKADKKVEFTTAPRLATAWDFPITSVDKFLWGPTGTHLAISGTEPTSGKNPRSIFLLVPYPAVEPNTPEPVGASLGKYSDFVGFTPDGKHIITDMREYNLASGYHKLHFRDVSKKPKNEFFQIKWPEGDWLMATLDREQIRTIEFDGREVHGYAFPPDGNTFRTMRAERDDDGNIIKMEVLEVDTTTGKTGKSLLTVNNRWSVLAPDGRRLAVVDKDGLKITMYNVNRGVKLFEHKVPAEKLASKSDYAKVAFSQDGRWLVVYAGISQTFVLNAETGAAQPALEWPKKGLSGPGYPPAFSRDGRLLALPWVEYRELPKRSGGSPTFPGYIGNPTKYLTVWDTQTGKVLKTWTGSPRAAFHPTKYLLAICEPNGESETRIGFWNFATEVEKK